MRRPIPEIRRLEDERRRRERAHRTLRWQQRRRALRGGAFVLLALLLALGCAHLLGLFAWPF